MVSPLAMVRSTCCTAVTMPRRVWNSTVRSRMSRSGIAVMTASSSPLRVDDIAKPVAKQIEAEHRDHQREPWKERDPPLAGHHEGGALRHHDPPLRGRRADTQADERQARGIEDG